MSLHEAYRVAGWPIPTKFWTTTHFALFTMVQENIDAARTRAAKRVRRTAQGFDEALDAATKG